MRGALTCVYAPTGLSRAHGKRELESAYTYFESGMRMSAPGKTAARSDVAGRLAFFKALQTVTNRIHSTLDADQIVFELAADICALFDAERLTIYTLDDGGDAIVTKLKTGLEHRAHPATDRRNQRGRLRGLAADLGEYCRRL